MNANHCIRLSLTSVLFLSACAAPPPPVDKHSVDQSAVKVLEESVYYAQLFESCAALGGDVEVEAISKQQDWLHANTELMLAADQAYNQQQAANTFEYRGKTLSPAAIKLALNARQRAQQELALHQRTPVNKVKTCEFRLGKITGDAMYLARYPEIAPYTSELLKYSPMDQQADDIPSLAGGISDVPTGASYYKQAKAHEASCPASAFTLSIVNQWPAEVYANFCSDKAVEVLTCEWGKCEAKKL